MFTHAGGSWQAGGGEYRGRHAMSTVHYKFKNAKNYDNVVFDGPYITVAALKADIVAKAFGPSSEVDLQVINAQTKQGTDHQNSISLIAISFN